MELSVLSCFLIAVWYWVINCDLGNLGRALMNPCLNGVLFGLVFGDVVTGTIIGATINIMYISIAAVGANMPADDSLAACVAIPIALTSGLDPATAVLLATPFGILGTFMDNARRMVNGYWNRKAHRDAQALNFKGISMDGTIYPFLTQFIVRVPIVFAIMLGVPVAAYRSVRGRRYPSGIWTCTLRDFYWEKEFPSFLCPGLFLHENIWIHHPGCSCVWHYLGNCICPTGLSETGR